MKKIITLRLCLLILLNIFSAISFSQTIINYQTWTGASGCNIFASSINVPVTINGTNNTIAHLTAIGQPTYDNVNKSVNLDTKVVNASLNQGTAYAITVNFKKDYSYKITLNASLIKTISTDPNALLRLDLNNGGNGGNTTCNGTGIIDASGSGGLKQSLQINSTTFTDYVFNYTPLTSYEIYLVIAAIPQTGMSSTQTILIRKITIEETPPPVTFTLPASKTFGCGTNTAQTFTVTNVYGTTGITNYTWHLGSASNNWLYNGSPAPQTISTGTNGSISLTPVCGAVQTNISATITANGNTYNTNTSVVSYTPPVVTMAGNNLLCSGSASFQLNGLPCNSTVVWSATPSGVVSLAPNGGQVAVTKTGNGVVALSASISVPCSSTPVVVSETIDVGPPSFNGTPVYHTEYGVTYPLMLTLPWGNPPIPNEICKGYGGRTDINIIGATSIVWSKTDQSSGASVTWFSDSYNDLNFWIHNAGHWAAFKLAYGNGCGSGEVTYKFKAITCNPLPPQNNIVTGDQFTIAPNPASGMVTISQNSKSTLFKTTIGKEGIMQVSIMDINGILKKQQKSGAGTASMQLDVSGLIPGIYFVQITKGDIYEMQRLVIYR
ncbi:MAG: T9SS type A sorting domain-containing protein [Chitinophagaceae bacterium]|nr:T9SS type A sorting domain-containing protein [Chitinophagaceae bacterium]MCO5241271.1 T9SS type A sorting domain-containing protein [Chitinophagaceae bacterium]